MDLIYEQSLGNNDSDSQETLKPAPLSNDSQNALNKKTEESFEKLETEISKTYDVLETKASTWGSSLGSLWNNFKVEDVISGTKQQVEQLQLSNKISSTKTNLTKNLDQIQKNWITDEKIENSKSMLNSLSEKTNSYIDELDKELEQVESFAGTYVSKFGQFIKESVTVDAPEEDDDTIDENESNLLFNVGTAEKNNKSFKVSSNRTEAQLHLLHTSTDLYLSKIDDESFPEFKSNLKIDSKTEEISKLLQSNKDLEQLASELVPTKINYDEFWYRYFFLFDKVHKEELERKKLLEKSPSKHEHGLEWDDEEEEEEDGSNSKGKSTASSDGTYELRSVNSSTLDVTKTHEPEDISTSKKANKDLADNDKKGAHDNNDIEEDDDDWE